MMWSLLDLFRRRITSVARPATARPATTKRKGAARRWQPRLEVLEDRCVPSTSSIASNFNATAVAPGSTLWFNSVANVTAVGTASATIEVTNQTITFSDTKNGVTTPYTVSVPNAELILSSSAASATTTFNTALNEWVTTTPLGLVPSVSSLAIATPPAAISTQTMPARRRATKPT
jgi:hypothetical protein